MTFAAPAAALVEYKELMQVGRAVEVTFVRSDSIFIYSKSYIHASKRN